ncbi:MAG TPA: CHRD domain-containing protein [Gammaproteobacteria bacterium]|nr:CHRD domain-containing protein [Gammaproteobacteria bacterium]
MRVQAALVGGIVAVLLGSTAVAEEFSARLGRVPVDTRTQSSVQGLGQATAELDGDRLTIEGDFGGLLGPATEANLHMGVALGARGPVIHPLRVESQREGELGASVRLSPEQIQALHTGRLYIQIASEAAPDGNLWGWLLSE